MSHPNTQSQKGPSSCETALINPHNTAMRAWACRHHSVARQTQVQYGTFPLEFLQHSDSKQHKAKSHPCGPVVSVYLQLQSSFGPGEQCHLCFIPLLCQWTEECLCHRSTHGQAPLRSRCSAGADYVWRTCAHVEGNYSARDIGNRFPHMTDQKKSG